MPALPLTGERTVPGVPSETYWFRRHVAAYRFASRLAHGVVVDAGCGEGYGSAILARTARRVVALDLEEAVVGHAAGTYDAQTLVRADLCRAPLRDRSVDAIVALQVVEHLSCAEEFMERCGAALRSGGILVLSTPNRETFPSGLNPFHVHEYDSSELEALLRRISRDIRVLGLRHRGPLRALDAVLGEPVQHRLVREAYDRQPRWLRAVLRSVTSRDFRIDEDASSGLDLVAVARIEA